MGMNAHDLIKVRSANELLHNELAPPWVDESLSRAPYVVMRRAPLDGVYLPIGVRGDSRDKRYADFINLKNIINIFTPEQIVKEKRWINYNKGVFIYLEEIKNQMDDRGIDWGPIGSVGFELVSKVPTVNYQSDIDIIIRLPSELTPAYAQELIYDLNKIPVHIDVQVDTFEGSFSLQEYVKSEYQPIMFKTKDGPILKHVHRC